MTQQLIELVAVLACTLFAGAAVFVTAVEHPARLSCVGPKSRRSNGLPATNARRSCRYRSPSLPDSSE
jgi:hypothetical protein